MDNIRKYIPSDEKGLKNCIAELKKYESRFEPAWRIGEESTNELFSELKRSQNEGGEMYVYTVDGNIAGFISLTIENKNEEKLVGKIDCVYVPDVVVLPEYRGRGIGKKLMEKANQFAKEKGIKFIKLVVFSDNVDAVRLYEDIGFYHYETTMVKDVN